MDLAALADLYDTLVVDGPTSDTERRRPLVARDSSLTGIIDTITVAIGALPEPLAVWLDGSPASVLLASLACAAGRRPLAVTTHVDDVPRVDDGGDAASLLGLSRRRINLDHGLVQTWERLAACSSVPPADLWPAIAAVTAQQSGCAALLIGAGADVPAQTLDVPPVGRVRHDSADDARANYGCLPPRWGEWRLRMGLRRELIDPALAELHPSLLGAPPRPPRPLRPSVEADEERAAYDLDSAMHIDGYLRPVLSAASELAGLPIVAPLALPSTREALLASPEGPRRAWRRLVRERVHQDLTERARRRPLGLEARWLLAAESRPESLNPAAVTAGGCFDAVTVAHWLQLVAAQPNDAVNRLRARMLAQVAAQPLGPWGVGWQRPPGR